jgi:hypothetical protein
VKLQLSGTLGRGFQYAFNVGFSMAFVSAFYVLFYVRERVTNAKHLQFVSGVRGWMYWMTAFLWDLIVYIAPVILICIVFIAFQEEGLRTPAELGKSRLNCFITFKSRKIKIKCFLNFQGDSFWCCMHSPGVCCQSPTSHLLLSTCHRLDFQGSLLSAPF